VVAQALIVEHELADRAREPCALPPALPPSHNIGYFHRCGRTGGFDRVRSRTKLVRGDMGDDRRLTGRVGGVSRRPSKAARRGHRVTAGGASLHHPGLAARPCTYTLNRLAGSVVMRTGRLEQMENVFCAQRCPASKKVVIGVGQRAAAPDRDEARISLLREDHGAIILRGTVGR
jgi:hypothetical protein